MIEVLRAVPQPRTIEVLCQPDVYKKIVKTFLKGRKIKRQWWEARRRQEWGSKRRRLVEQGYPIWIFE